MKAQRQRLKLSAAEFGRLIGVSELTVYNWEHGKARPKKDRLAALVAVRQMGRREVMAKSWKSDAGRSVTSTCQASGQKAVQNVVVQPRSVSTPEPRVRGATLWSIASCPAAICGRPPAFWPRVLYDARRAVGAETRACATDKMPLTMAPSTA